MVTTLDLVRMMAQSSYPAEGVQAFASSLSGGLSGEESDKSLAIWLAIVLC